MYDVWNLKAQATKTSGMEATSDDGITDFDPQKCFYPVLRNVPSIWLFKEKTSSEVPLVGDDSLQQTYWERCLFSTLRDFIMSAP